MKAHSLSTKKARLDNQKKAEFEKKKSISNENASQKNPNHLRCNPSASSVATTPVPQEEGKEEMGALDKILANLATSVRSSFQCTNYVRMDERLDARLRREGRERIKALIRRGHPLHPARLILTHTLQRKTQPDREDNPGSQW